MRWFELWLLSISVRQGFSVLLPICLIHWLSLRMIVLCVYSHCWCSLWLLFVVDGIGINPAQTAGRCLDQGCPLQQHLAVINVILSALNCFSISKCNTGLEISALFASANACLFVYWFFNPPSIIFNFLFPTFSHFMKWETSSHSPFTCMAEISLPILHNHPHANEWILLFTASYCSCLSAWGPFERSNDFLRLLQ